MVVNTTIIMKNVKVIGVTVSASREPTDALSIVMSFSRMRCIHKIFTCRSENSKLFLSIKEKMTSVNIPILAAAIAPSATITPQFIFRLQNYILHLKLRLARVSLNDINQVAATYGSSMYPNNSADAIRNLEIAIVTSITQRAYKNNPFEPLTEGSFNQVINTATFHF